MLLPLAGVKLIDALVESVVAERLVGALIVVGGVVGCAGSVTGTGELGADFK